MTPWPGVHHVRLKLTGAGLLLMFTAALLIVATSGQSVDGTAKRPYASRRVVILLLVKSPAGLHEFVFQIVARPSATRPLPPTACRLGSGPPLGL
jgi:hypothetical protein